MALDSKEEVARQWTACLPSVAAYVRSMTNDFHDAHDILQDIAMVVVRKYSEYDPARPFSGWAIGIARNELLAYRRRQATYQQFFDDDSCDRIGEAFAAEVEDPGPLLEALQACMKQASPKTQKLLQLRYVDDLRYEKVAQALRTSVSSAKMAMCRLRAALRNCVERKLHSSRSI